MKARNTIPFITATELAAALGGRRSGHDWIARCPAHDDRKPSLSVREAKDGRVLIRCHAGCDQETVVAALWARGLWPGNGGRCAKFGRVERRQATIIFTFAIALGQLRIGQELVTNGFLIVFGAGALAAALAVGLGCREFVGRLIEERFGKGR